MTASQTPRLKSPNATRDQTEHAEQAQQTAAVGAAKCAAEGVVTAPRSDPRRADGRYPVAWLRITAPKGAVPTATSTCLCGWDRSAVGHRRVLALITDHDNHRDTCPLRNSQVGRNAA